MVCRFSINCSNYITLDVFQMVVSDSFLLFAGTVQGVKTGGNKKP